MDNLLNLPRLLRRRVMLLRPFVYPISSLVSHAYAKRLWRASEERKDERKRLPICHIPFSQKALNFFGCITVITAFVYAMLFIGNFLVIDTILSIFLAEYCNWNNKYMRGRGINKTEEHQEKAKALGLAEEGAYDHAKTGVHARERDCIAAIVGYREDPALFTMALESYQQAAGCAFLLTCIDGDESEDREMVAVFQRVFPTKSAIINLSVPFAEIALQMDETGSTGEEIVSKCVELAKQTFLENDLHFKGPSATTRLCVAQPHLHKKGIMFTSFIVSLAISEILDIEFLWTSDSDSTVRKNTLEKTFATIAGDAQCAGASTALSIFNRNDSLVTTLGNSVFLNSGLSRCFSSAVGANDCQSGPCAAFRINHLRSELVAWYKQTVLGHRMIVNEDRHITTRLLLRGHRIIFIPDAITSTETPVTLRRWLLQQVRWARSGHIESCAHPSIYLHQSPLLFLGALRRQLISFFYFGELFWYLFVGNVPVPLGWKDYAYRVLFTVVYLKLRNPAHATWAEWSWSIPTGLFYNILVPAIQAWSLITVFADSWGTTMRGCKEESHGTYWDDIKNKAWESGFFVAWMGVVGGAIGRWISYRMELQGVDTLLSVGVGMAAMWSVFGYWLVVGK